MLNDNIIFIVIVVVIAFVSLTVIMNEGFCNCSGTGVKYASQSPAPHGSYGGGGYKTNYGWPVAMPYDSFARQMTSKRDVNNCVPNMQAVDKMTCSPDMFQTTYRLDNKPKCAEVDANFASDRNMDYGSVNKNAYTKTVQKPIIQDHPTFQANDQMMLQSPEMSYKTVYTAARGPGRYGYGSKAGGMTSYSFAGSSPGGCGFPLLSAGPPSCSGPAGSFEQPPMQSSGCTDTSGYNLSVGVM